MPSPRADFECQTCQATYEDLPAESVRCGVCGKKRGFRRLFNRIQVATASRSGPEVREFSGKRDQLRRQVDDLIQPMLERRQALMSGKEAHQQKAAQVQEQIAAAPRPNMPAGAAGWHQAIPSESRDASRGITWPVIEMAKRRGGPRPMYVNSDPAPPAA
jgi:DNA-directed RNA polymerase subunit RPC12/RpoP